MKICIINGPNLNLLGMREEDVYGEKTLEKIIEDTENRLAGLKGVTLEWFQSNAEHEIVQKIQTISQKKGEYQALIINPGAYSHSSISIYDALLCFKPPIVEVHLSNTFKRESFRQTLLTARAVDFIMKGLGEDAYYTAIWYLFSKLGA